MSPLNVKVQLDPGGGAVMAGNSGDGTWTGDLTAYGATSTKPVTQSGQYTLIAPGMGNGIFLGTNQTGRVWMGPSQQ